MPISIFTQDLGKILWGEKPLTSPINFDYILTESKNINYKKLSGSFYINSYPKGIGYDVIRDEKTFKNRKNEDLFNNQLLKFFTAVNLSSWEIRDERATIIKF